MQATMIKIERNAKMEAAIARCKSVRPKVRRVSADTVEVSGRGGHYTVKLLTPREGLRLANCDCTAGQRGQLCYHIPAALSAPTAPLCPAPSAARIERKVERDASGQKYTVVRINGRAI
jgi:hypothetical protein